MVVTTGNVQLTAQQKRGRLLFFTPKNSYETLNTEREQPIISIVLEDNWYLPLAIQTTRRPNNGPMIAWAVILHLEIRSSS